MTGYKIKVSTHGMVDGKNGFEISDVTDHRVNQDASVLFINHGDDDVTYVDLSCVVRFTTSGRTKQ